MSQTLIEPRYTKPLGAVVDSTVPAQPDVTAANTQSQSFSSVFCNNIIAIVIVIVLLMIVLVSAYWLLKNTADPEPPTASRVSNYRSGAQMPDVQFTNPQYQQQMMQPQSQQPHQFAQPQQAMQPQQQIAQPQQPLAQQQVMQSQQPQQQVMQPQSQQQIVQSQQPQLIVQPQQSSVQQQIVQPQSQPQQQVVQQQIAQPQSQQQVIQPQPIVQSQPVQPVHQYQSQKPNSSPSSVTLDDIIQRSADELNRSAPIVDESKSEDDSAPFTEQINNTPSSSVILPHVSICGKSLKNGKLCQNKTTNGSHCSKHL